MLPEALTRLLAVPRNLPWQPLPHAHRQRVDVTDDFNWRPSVAKLRFLQRSGFRCAGCGLVSAPSTEVPSGYLELVAAEHDLRRAPEFRGHTGRPTKLTRRAEFRKQRALEGSSGSSSTPS